MWPTPQKERRLNGNQAGLWVWVTRRMPWGWWARWENLWDLERKLKGTRRDLANHPGKVQPFKS